MTDSLVQLFNKSNVPKLVFAKLKVKNSFRSDDLPFIHVNLLEQIMEMNVTFVTIPDILKEES
jgi:uncharacterized protein with PQ loop repeat